MKKILILVLLIFFCAGSAFCGEFEDTLKKAEQGDVIAQYNLGSMYDNGKGTTQNFKQAFYWYKKSAEQGNAYAQYNLAAMYYNGEGITQNYKQAYIWGSLASAQGHKEAPKFRDTMAKKLIPQQLAEAQDLATQMQEKIDSAKKP